MNDISQYSAIAIIMIFLIKEMFSYLKTKKNGNGNYKAELAGINNKLSNHLHDVNGHIADIEREMTAMKIDLEIIKNNLNDIKLAIK